MAGEGRREKNQSAYLYSTMKYVLLAIGLYVLYQFIFKLVIPVWRASRKIKQGFREMQSRMQEQMQQQQAAQQQQSPAREPKHKAGDYIEFEDVRARHGHASVR